MARVLPRRGVALVTSQHPRIGLVTGSEGAAAVATHARLMEAHCSLVPLRLLESADERDWIGRITPWDDDGMTGWTIQAALMRADRLGVRGQVPNRDVYWRSMADAIRSLARRENLAALHIHGWHADAPAAVLAAATADLPLIVTFQGSDLDTGLFTATAQMHAAVAAASACACRSEGQARLLGSVFAPRCRLHVVPHHVTPVAVDDGGWPCLVLPVPVLGCVGRLDRGMGLDVLLEAFDIVADRRDCSLILAGPLHPSDAAWVAALLASARHGDRIVQLGHLTRDGLPRVRRACDLLVLPCVAEGHEVDVLEGLRDRRAVVTSNLPALAEMRTGDVEGWVLPPRDARALAGAIERCLETVEGNRALPRDADRDVLVRFHPDGERASWLDCYRSTGLEL